MRPTDLGSLAGPTETQFKALHHLSGLHLGHRGAERERVRERERESFSGLTPEYCGKRPPEQ